MDKIKTALDLISCIQSFEPLFTHGDEDWTFYFRLKGKWQQFHAKKYKNTFYIFSPAFDSLEIQDTGEINLDISPHQVELLAACAEQISGIYKLVLKDPTEYYRTLQKSLPPALRKGMISRKFVNQLIPDYMAYHKEFSASEREQILAFLMTPNRHPKVEEMTAGKYFDYCRLAYLANPARFEGKLDEHMSGLDMYKSWADGRDGGLSKLPLDDAKAMQEWYDSKGRMGDHPWEIYRGGNSTHIDLAITKEYGDWKIQIIAFSSTRLVEACRIALALHKVGLPFELAHADSYQRRLLAEDYVGILPETYSLKYGWHNFPKEFHVADCIQYSWFKDENNRSLLPMTKIKSLITWFPIRPLFVKTAGQLEKSELV